jgi:hypothetical protein
MIRVYQILVHSNACMPVYFLFAQEEGFCCCTLSILVAELVQLFLSFIAAAEELGPARSAALAARQDASGSVVKSFVQHL